MRHFMRHPNDFFLKILKCVIYKLLFRTYGDSIYGTEKGYEVIFDKPINRFDL